MATNNISINVHDHGVEFDDKKKKVQRNYCCKVVSDFYRLKCQLGALRGDVLPCELVSSNIKEHFSTKLNEVKRVNLVKEVDNLQHPDLPLNRSSSTALLQDVEPINNGVSMSTSRKRVEETSTSSDGSRRGQDVPSDRGIQPNYKELLRSKTTQVLIPQAEMPMESQKCIGKFFYDTDIDLHAVKAQPSIN